MRIRIACVGKLKEPYLRAAEEEYVRRLGRYAQISILEAADEPAPERLSDAQRIQVMEAEAERLLRLFAQSPRKEHVVALCIAGRQYTSEAFAQALSGWMEAGGASVTFVIGGSLGLATRITQRADALLSLSDMTFPHQIARILLLEQLYRAYRINANEPYHK